MTQLIMRRLAISYIRYSSRLQTLGKSEERQYERAVKYCIENNLELIEDYRDLGVSGYKQHNVKEGGSLRLLLNDIKSGRIPPKCVIIVESIDRLTRATPYDAQGILREIIDADVSLVVLDSYLGEINREILLEDGGQKLMWLHGEMQRAHYESKRKSELITDARNRELANAKINKTVISGKLPAWLTKNSNKKAEVIPGRDDIIRQIFNLYIEGHGAYGIAKRLNEQKIPVWGRGAGWRDTYIKKIIVNRAVIGECQPMTIVDGKRIPKSEPIPDLFPAVVDKDIFDTAQGIKQQRNTGHKGGRTGKLHNLFGNKYRCSHCSSKLEMNDKGYGYHLLCPNCKYRIKYGEYKGEHHLEKSLLKYLKNIDYLQIVDSNVNDRRKAIKISMSKIDGELKEIADLVDKITNEITDPNGNELLIEALKQKLAGTTEKKKKLERDKDSLNIELTSISNNVITSSLETIDDLFELLYQNNDEEKRINIRHKLKTAIDSIVEKLVITPPNTERKTGWASIHYKTGRVKKNAVPIRSKSINTIEWREKYHNYQLEPVPDVIEDGCVLDADCRYFDERCETCPLKEIHNQNYQQNDIKTL